MIFDIWYLFETALLGGKRDGLSSHLLSGDIGVKRDTYIYVDMDTNKHAHTTTTIYMSDMGINRWNAIYLVGGGTFSSGAFSVFPSDDDISAVARFVRGFVREPSPPSLVALLLRQTSSCGSLTDYIGDEVLIRDIIRLYSANFLLPPTEPRTQREDIPSPAAETFLRFLARPRHASSGAADGVSTSLSLTFTLSFTIYPRHGTRNTM